MDFLWSPWRFQYISTTQLASGCVFCEAPRLEDDQSFILHRGHENFIILNIFPYITGHVMVAPYAHLASPTEAGKSTTDEMMDLAMWCIKALSEVYQPHGHNLGMNLGRAAGAGIADHFHLHLLPRWFGDTNFTTVVGETRVLPEDLPMTYMKLKRFLEAHPPYPHRGE